MIVWTRPPAPHTRPRNSDGFLARLIFREAILPAGRPPTPTERKRRTGNPGHRPLPEPVVELAAVAAIPAPPATLGDVGAAVWDRLWTAGQAWLSPTTDLDI